MKNIYYMLWSDAIRSFKQYHPQDTDWKLTLIIFISFLNGLNWFIIFIWLKFFNILNIPLINIHIFPLTKLNDFLSFNLEFSLPFGIINYFLIFYKNRYELIVKKYDNVEPMFALNYSVIIIIAALFSGLLYATFKS